MRHGDADYRERGTKIYQGFGENFAPLTERGVEQILAAASNARLRGVDLILSSPYTRAMQTTAIISEKTHVTIKVETDLHEWLADKNYSFLDADTAGRCCTEFNTCGGNYPDSASYPWENNDILRSRLLCVLDRYSSYSAVIVVCHGMLMHSLFPDRWFANGEIAVYDIGV